jgi:hypothetical protein
MKVTIRTSVTSSSREITKEKISMYEYKFGKVRKVEKAIKSMYFKSKEKSKVRKKNLK